VGGHLIMVDERVKVQWLQGMAVILWVGVGQQLTELGSIGRCSASCENATFLLNYRHIYLCHSQFYG